MCAVNNAIIHISRKLQVSWE